MQCPTIYYTIVTFVLLLVGIILPMIVPNCAATNSAKDGTGGNERRPNFGKTDDKKQKRKRNFDNGTSNFGTNYQQFVELGPQQEQHQQQHNKLSKKEAPLRNEQFFRLFGKEPSEFLRHPSSAFNKSSSSNLSSLIHQQNQSTNPNMETTFSADKFKNQSTQLFNSTQQFPNRMGFGPQNWHDNFPQNLGASANLSTDYSVVPYSNNNDEGLMQVVAKYIHPKQ